MTFGSIKRGKLFSSPAFPNLIFMKAKKDKKYNPKGDLGIVVKGDENKFGEFKAFYDYSPVLKERG